MAGEARKSQGEIEIEEIMDIMILRDELCQIGGCRYCKCMTKHADNCPLYLRYLEILKMHGAVIASERES